MSESMRCQWRVTGGYSGACGSRLTSQGICINNRFLASALKQQGPWRGEDIDVNLEWCVAELEKAIRSIDWRATSEDVRRFVRVVEQPSLDL